MRLFISAMTIVDSGSLAPDSRLAYPTPNCYARRSQSSWLPDRSDAKTCLLVRPDTAKNYSPLPFKVGISWYANINAC